MPKTSRCRPSPHSLALSESSWARPKFAPSLNFSLICLGEGGGFQGKISGGRMSGAPNFTGTESNSRRRRDVWADMEQFSIRAAPDTPFCLFGCLPQDFVDASKFKEEDAAPCTLNLHPKLCPLHPSPFTLRTSPCVIHPAPSTLDPPPSTLHPSAYTMHPPP